MAANKKVYFISLDNDEFMVSAFSTNHGEITITSECDTDRVSTDLDIETAEAFVDHLETCIAEAKRFRDSKNEKE